MSKPDSIPAFDERAIRGMPTEMLHALYTGLHKELSRRRAMEAVGRKTLMAADVCRPIKREKRKYSRCHLEELDGLMAQDWSHLFPEGDATEKYYVYVHLYPGLKGRDFRAGGEFSLALPGTPFYVGKGCEARAWDLKRNEGHGVELRTLTSRGHTADQIVHIVRDKLTERAALEIESKLIYFFGTKFERDRRGLLVNLDIPKRPF